MPAPDPHRRLAAQLVSCGIAVPRIGSPPGVAQRDLSYLAVLGQRHFGDDPDKPRNGEIGHFALAMPDDLDGIKRMARFELNGGRNLILAEFGWQRIDG